MALENPNRLRSLSAALGCALALPVVLFVTFNILKYEFGLLTGIEIIPVHPAILLGTALAAVLLNAWAVLQIRLERRNDTLWIKFGFTNRPWNWAVLALAGLFLLALLTYAVVENAAAVLGI